MTSMTKQLQTQLLSKLNQLTPDALDNLALKGETILIATIAYTSDMVVPQLPGGWMAKYVGRMVDGARGKIILLPEHTHTRRHWTEGQKYIALKAGLTESQAEAWLNSQVPQRQEMLPMIAEILKDPARLEGYLSYSKDFSTDEFQRWSARTGIVDKMHPERRAVLTTLLKEIVEPAAKRKAAKRKGRKPTANDIDEAMRAELARPLVVDDVPAQDGDGSPAPEDQLHPQEQVAEVDLTGQAEAAE